MPIQQMVKSWGVIFPEGNNDNLYLPEYLLQKYPSKCYFADFFPKPIPKSYAHKHTQIEGKIYDLICNRMYRAILKLWVYDNLYFESDLLSSRMVFKKYFKRRKLLKKLTTNCIEREENLRTLMDLSRNNVIDIVLAFEKNHIVIIPSWSCFFLFVEDDSALPLIKDALGAEGLCLRKNFEARQGTVPCGDGKTT